MILEFSNLKEDEEENSKKEITNTKLRKQKQLEYFCKLKRNILDFFLIHNELYTEGQIIQKSNSEPNLKKRKKNISTKKNKVIYQKKNEINYNNLNIQEEKNKIYNEEINKNLKDKNKINNKIECNIYYNNNNKEKAKVNNKESFEIISNNNILNNINDLRNDVNIKDDNIYFNQKNNIHKNVGKNSDNVKSSSFNNSNNLANSPLNQLEDNSSLNSCKNENVIKNISTTNKQRKSFYSSSSFGRNFILKNKICKSTKINENSDDNNPIMTYYMGKSLGNFYLLTDRKSQEELDGNQYMNFFPINEKETKNKDKDIMSCIYIDNKLQNSQVEISKEINNVDIKKEEENHDIFEMNNFNKDKGIDGNNEANFDFNLNINNNDFIKNNNNSTGYNIDLKFNMNSNNINNNILNSKNNDIDNIFKDIKDNNFNENKENNNLDLINNNIENNKNIDNFLLENDNKINNNDFEFPMSKRKGPINYINNYIENDNIKSLNSNENYNLKLPISFTNPTFNLNDNNLKEFKINQEILNEISNLNKNINSNYFMNSNYKLSSENFFNSSNKQDDNLYFNNNEININNINFNSNINNILNSNDFSLNNFGDNINIFNSLPINKSFYDYTDDELLQYAIPLIKDQSGCRFLQEKIKSNQYFANEQLFPTIKNNIKELACDPFGNYFLQVLIEVLTYDNVNILLDLIQNGFTYICICPHGTRVIQKIIEKIFTNAQLMNKFISILNSKDLGTIFKSPYGNHIIQKFLSTVHNQEYTKFIYNYTLSNFMEIAETKHGVCVIQKCVSEGDEEQRKKIYDLILNNFDILIKDQFANYLIQYILINTTTKEKFNEISPLINKIEENLLDYCKSKYSANVIEKCFENNDNYIREHILQYLLINYKDNIIDILLDQYGIYIIQKALKLNSVYKSKLCEIINKKENELRNININEFKYRGILKIINSNKELGLIFSKTKENGTTHTYNYNNTINKEFEHRNNNRCKNKRGKKNYRGNNSKYS